ncbi:MAG: pyruvate formate lyase-activating protein, partial [Anaerolineae bacterium]
MHILAVDIGTGTQDILWFDSARDPENCLKLVMPSPTLRVAGQIRQATAARQPLLLSGVLMGGGPSAWAAEDHHKA